ncbi:MAG: exodeoxyribonuclease VII large subunit [Nanoarchaeota archaeon]
MVFGLFEKKKESPLSELSEVPDVQNVDARLIDKRIFSVSEITRHIKMILEGDKSLVNFYLRGEISSPKQYTSGHTYFTLKDETSQISCILFRRNRENMKFNLEHGMKVIIKGSIEVYEPYGKYNIIVEEIHPEGIGALNLAFIQLKDKLEKQGLFSAKHKKQLPKFPKTIGLITSLSGAVMHDVLNVLKRRYPLVKVLIVPTMVQGKGASNSVIDAIELINQYGVEVIILARGGGSLEDLWCFNEESVARAIFQSKIPIISAIGHETDFTIADFVADYRAPTPSVAAEKAVPDINELKKLIETFDERMLNAIHNLIKTNKYHLDQIANRPIFKKPLEAIRAYYQKIESFEYMLQTKIAQYLNLKRKNLEILDSKLSALNPKAILERGYSIVMKGDRVIKNANDVQIDNNINVIFYKGELEAEVKKIKK